MNVWYRVRDLDAGRAFYTGVLGFEETFVDEDARWGDEADVPLERYVAGWGRPGDDALVAIDELDRKSTRLNSSHIQKSRMPSSA